MGGIRWFRFKACSFQPARYTASLILNNRLMWADGKGRAMFRRILSTGVAVMISSGMTSQAGVRDDNLLPVTEAAEADSPRMTTFHLVGEGDFGASQLCEQGFEVPVGGLFLAPVPD